MRIGTEYGSNVWITSGYYRERPGILLTPKPFRWWQLRVKVRLLKHGCFKVPKWVSEGFYDDVWVWRWQCKAS